MKKLIFYSILITMIFINPAQALIVLTSKAIDFNKKSGELKAYVVLGNKIQKATALGKYKVSSNAKSVVFNVESIVKDNQTYPLSSQPTLIKPIKNKILKKGSKLILAGENQEEIAKIFGLSLEDYQKKSGTKAKSDKSTSSSGSSTSGSSSSGSSSGSSGSSSSTGSSSNGFNSSTGGEFGNGYFPTNSSGNTGTNYYPVPDTSTSNTNSDTANAEYSTQFCKAPYYDSKNSISLSFIAKDGSCIDIKASRDDTKCEYRYDFNNGVAIKQTQFYYIDNENNLKNVGGCVDLQGDEFRFPLYKDDSKCKLQTTNNKGYNGNQAWFFQTQILFRGADGLIHMAQDCTDYQNVQEELISYEKDDKSREIKRIVNQYYIDPNSGDRVYINNGIISPFKFPYREYTCGAWEMDDTHLQAYRRTQIKAFDNVANQYVDITSCDYSNDNGKSGRVTLPYIQLPSNEKDGGVDKGDMNGEYEFEFKQRILGSGGSSTYQSCGWGQSDWYNYTKYWNGGFKTTKWKTTYKTTNTGVTTGWQRPKQEDEKEPSVYYTSKRVKTIDRKTIVLQNDLNLNADYMKFYEINEGYYKEESIKETKEYADFISKYYKPKKGTCQSYSFDSIVVRDSDWNCHTARGENGRYWCSLYNNYVLP